MKERVYEITCWQGFINHVKENVGRELTEGDYHVLMTSYYIKGIPAEKAVKDLKEG